MATAAQIEANRRNSKLSTGPKTDQGKAKSRLNSYRHGMTARTIMPVLPQEDPGELEERIRQAIAALQPRNPAELDLVCCATKLSAEIDRAERIGTAHLAHRVRMATRSAADATSARKVRKVHELGSKLFFQSVIGPGYSAASPDDYPAVIVRRLEESAEGCHWLLARWGELLNVVNCEADWGDAEIVRLVGLLGKRGIEAHFDPELNALFHAFDQLGDRLGQTFWCERRDRLPLGYNGGLKYLPYRTIAEPPADKNQALVFICTIIEREVRRLEELLAEHEEIETDEAAERYDRAALDCSRAFERHRRSQSARTRELLSTLEAFRKMRKEEFGTGDGGGGMADGKCRMTNGKCQMADGQARVAEEQGQMTDGGRDDCDQRAKLTDENCHPSEMAGADPVLGRETQLVGDQSADVEMEATDQRAQDVCDEQTLRPGTTVPEKAPDEANLQSTQNPSAIIDMHSVSGKRRRKRSQTGNKTATAGRRGNSGQWQGLDVDLQPMHPVHSHASARGTEAERLPVG